MDLKNVFFAYGIPKCCPVTIWHETFVAYFTAEKKKRLRIIAVEEIGFLLASFRVNSSSKRSNRCRGCRRKIDDVAYLESINSEYVENSSPVFRRKFPERVRAEVDSEMIPHRNEFHNPSSEIESNEDGDFIIPYEIIQDRFPELSVSAGAAVYLSAVLEYLLAELVDISGTAAKKLKRCRIDPWAMAAALSTDEELRLLFESKDFEESTAEKTVYIAHGEIENDVSSTSSSQSKVKRKCILLVYD